MLKRCILSFPVTLLVLFYGILISGHKIISEKIVTTEKITTARWLLIIPKLTNLLNTVGRTKFCLLLCNEKKSSSEKFHSNRFFIGIFILNKYGPHFLKFFLLFTHHCYSNETYIILLSTMLSKNALFFWFTFNYNYK